MMEIKRDINIPETSFFCLDPEEQANPLLSKALLIITLSAYVDIYLREEIMAEGLVRNPGTFTRFLEIISFSHGAVLNVSNLARECQTGIGIVTGYIDILEDLLLAYSLTVFSRRAKGKTASHPKFYLFDNGLSRSIACPGLQRECHNET